MEGEGYVLNGFNRPAPKFRANYGKGMMEIGQAGSFDLFYKNYGDRIASGKPRILAKNIIMGGLYIDMEGDFEAVSQTTGCRIKMSFIARKG